MNALTYIVVAVIILILIVGIIGLLLPNERIYSRQSIYEAPAKLVFEIITDNEKWSYRSDLRDLKIIEKQNGIEMWEETSKDGNTIRFKTREKKPYTYYSFDMESKIMKGHWEAKLDELDSGNTVFTATECIQMTNPFIKVISYLFFDLGKLMEIHQQDLKKEIDSMK